MMTSKLRKALLEFYQHTGGYHFDQLIGPHREHARREIMATLLDRFQVPGRMAGITALRAELIRQAEAAGLLRDGESGCIAARERGIERLAREEWEARAKAIGPEDDRPMMRPSEPAPVADDDDEAWRESWRRVERQVLGG